MSSVPDAMGMRMMEQLLARGRVPGMLVGSQLIEDCRLLMVDVRSAELAIVRRVSFPLRSLHFKNQHSSFESAAHDLATTFRSQTAPKGLTSPATAGPAPIESIRAACVQMLTWSRAHGSRDVTTKLSGLFT
jgi:hypothetical protein